MMNRARRTSTAVVSVAVLALLAIACGGGEEPSETEAAPGSPTAEATASPTEEAAASCTAVGAGQFAGPTSEDLCVGFELDASGDISAFELEIMTTCAFGSGEGIQLLGEGETVSSDAAFDAGEPFPAIVTFEPPIEVGADGSFASGNLSGTISGDDAQGSYELSFTSPLNESLTCSGGPITWSATRAE
jgi:hypothetical protein